MERQRTHLGWESPRATAQRAIFPMVRCFARGFVFLHAFTLTLPCACSDSCVPSPPTRRGGRDRPGCGHHLRCPGGPTAHHHLGEGKRHCTARTTFQLFWVLKGFKGNIAISQAQSLAMHIPVFSCSSFQRSNIKPVTFQDVRDA